MVIISGRALRDLVPLLGIEPLPELWGSHGWERLDRDGRYHEPQLEPAVRDALLVAQQWAHSAGLNGRCEQKPASIALHWRGADADTVGQIAARVREAWGPLARPPLLELCEFDGGLELRAAGRDKGHAVSSILAELNESAAVAYAGDDRTDEDAFRALSGRGLSILVRPEYRETAADVWLRPPDELARFLRAWLAIDMEGE
jgi:trehalose-phosphatase